MVLTVTRPSSVLPTTARPVPQHKTHNPQPQIPSPALCIVSVTTCTNRLFSPAQPVLQRGTHWAVLPGALCLAGILVLTLLASSRHTLPAEASKDANSSSPEDFPSILCTLRAQGETVCGTAFLRELCAQGPVSLCTSLYLTFTISFLFAFRLSSC